MAGKSVSNRLYWKISLTLLVLLAILGVVYIQITSYIGKQYLQEVNQRLYGGIADSTTNLVRPLVDGKVDTLAIQDIMHSTMVMNPSVEVYLLDTVGTIITYVAPNKKIKLKSVNLDPIHEFIKHKEYRFIKGDDPRFPNRGNVFSAAPIYDEEQHLEGYLYIILASEEQSAVSSNTMGGYMLELGTNLFLLSLIAALLIGLLVMWFLTRNLSYIIEIFNRFKNGDYKARIADDRKGDFEILGNTFNEMADQIVENIDAIKSVEKLRQELIANVSHDLRTPLTIMQGYIETLLMKNEDLTSKERKQYLQTMLGSSEGLAQLVAQLFEYSKLEAKQIQPNKEPFILSELVQDILQKYQILAKEKEIQLSLEIEGRMTPVLADVMLIKRVIQNLLDNALKFTPARGEIKIALKPVEKHIEVRVIDTGRGIPKNEQAFIFNRYHKATKDKNNKMGAGLGLAIVKKILEIHDSIIQVSSQLNQGTAFWFLLPIYQED